MSDKLYLDRECEEAENIIGTQMYLKHVYSMTKEELHSKSSIALELARRDFDIESLEAKLEACNSLLEYDDSVMIDDVSKIKELESEIEGLKWYKDEWNAQVERIRDSNE